MTAKVVPGPSRKFASTVVVGNSTSAEAAGVAVTVGVEVVVDVVVAVVVTGDVPPVTGRTGVAVGTRMGNPGSVLLSSVTATLVVTGAVVVTGVVASSGTVGVSGFCSRSVVTRSSVAIGKLAGGFPTRNAANQRPLLSRYHVPSAFWATIRIDWPAPTDVWTSKVVSGPLRRFAVMVTLLTMVGLRIWGGTVVVRPIVGVNTTPCVNAVVSESAPVSVKGDVTAMGANGVMTTAAVGVSATVSDTGTVVVCWSPKVIVIVDGIVAVSVFVKVKSNCKSTVTAMLSVSVAVLVSVSVVAMVLRIIKASGTCWGTES